MLIVFKVEHIHHEADQRSKDFPGHGYPAHTEDIQAPEMFSFTDSVELENELVKLYNKDKNRKDMTVLEINKVVPVGVSLKIELG